MAGLKASQLNDNPVAFWTFDFDRVGMNGNLIIDEIGNRNPMIINSDLAGDNYWLQRQSLNEIETADQYSMSIAINQKVDNHWREQFFEVVHTNQFEFPDKGEFSVEWLMYKSQADDIRNSLEAGYRSNITTPLIIKGDVLDVSITDYYYSSNDSIRVVVLGDRVLECHNSTYPIWDRSLHCVVTYKVTQTDINEYESVVTLWVNGHLIQSDTKTHIDIFPNTNTSASWLFCGNGGRDARHDFATERLTMDQIAVYSYALTVEQVANHYRKTKQYDRMIIDDRPQRYWRLDEVDDPLNTTITSDVGNIDGAYYGAVNRYRPGPPRLANSRAPFFQKGSSGYIDEFDNYSRFTPIVSPNQDYTLEFWFRLKDIERGILFDCSEEAPISWAGIRVFANSKNNRHSPGSIQVSESKETFLNSLDLNGNGDRYLFNDDDWHHLVMQREGNALTLYLDGFLHSQGDFAKVSVGKPGQIHLMNSRPGDYSVEGYICEIAFYQRALQYQQIYNRYIFSTRYKIFGYTLLQGAPVQSTLRFYDSVTGELVDSVVSNSLTGEYVYYPLNNRHLDIVSKLPNNNTTRYRIHGPVAPAEYNDTHLQ